VTGDRHTISLAAVRDDGWFERLSGGSPDFEQLCDVVGNNFVAFAAIAGVRITAVTVDRDMPDATIVDFVVGEDRVEQRLPLGEFRRRLAIALASDDASYPTELDGDAGPEELRSFLGFQYVLLAPLFGIGLIELIVATDAPVEVIYESDDGQEQTTVGNLRETIREQVRALAGASPTATPFAIDLSALPAAETAMAAEDFDRAIELLGSWPGPLSMLLRTAEGHALTPDVKATLAHALGLLGTAYARRDRHDWADEVMRLGIQWGQEGPAAGELFWRMGEASLGRERHGEAIGLLRRSLALGASRAVVLPMLARCYAARDRWVAAALCAEEAIIEGAEQEEMRALLDSAVERLGAPWRRFRDQIPGPRPLSATVPAPSGKE